MIVTSVLSGWENGGTDIFIVTENFFFLVASSNQEFRTHLVILAVRNIVLLVNIGYTYVRIYNIVILANKQYSTGISLQANNTLLG